jgi:hypothetical protein
MFTATGSCRRHVTKGNNNFSYQAGSIHNQDAIMQIKGSNAHALNARVS